MIWMGKWWGRSWLPVDVVFRSWYSYSFNSLILNLIWFDSIWLVLTCVHLNWLRIDLIDGFVLSRNVLVILMLWSLDDDDDDRHRSMFCALPKSSKFIAYQHYILIGNCHDFSSSFQTNNKNKNNMKSLNSNVILKLVYKLQLGYNWISCGFLVATGFLLLSVSVLFCSCFPCGCFPRLDGLPRNSLCGCRLLLTPGSPFTSFNGAINDGK